MTIPDLRSHAAARRLQPRVDADTLARVREHLQQRVGQQVGITVVNPNYDRIKLSFEVRFRKGEDFNHRRLTLNEELVCAPRRGPSMPGWTSDSVARSTAPGWCSWSNTCRTSTS